jgi:hypothetical protein
MKIRVFKPRTKIEDEYKILMSFIRTGSISCWAIYFMILSDAGGTVQAAL